MSAPEAKYFDVTPLPQSKILRVVRLPKPFPVTDDLAPMFAATHEAAEALGDKSEWRLLLDLRNATGRNDPNFEALVAPERSRLERGFLKVAVVVRSLVGRMQVERHAREDGLNLRVFLDDGEAVAWLTAPERPFGR